MTSKPLPLQMLKTHLHSQGLVLKDSGEVLNPDRFVAHIAIASITYDGEDLRYRVSPMSALNYVDVSFNLEDGTK